MIRIHSASRYVTWYHIFSLVSNKGPSEATFLPEVFFPHRFEAKHPIIVSTRRLSLGGPWEWCMVWSGPVVSAGVETRIFPRDSGWHRRGVDRKWRRPRRHHIWRSTSFHSGSEGSSSKGCRPWCSLSSIEAYVQRFWWTHNHTIWKCEGLITSNSLQVVEISTRDGLCVPSQEAAYRSERYLVWRLGAKD